MLAGAIVVAAASTLLAACVDSDRLRSHLGGPTATAEADLDAGKHARLADSALRTRFERETMAALPVGSGASTDEVFAALEWRRLRLRQDQQVPEWAGARSLKAPTSPG